MKRYYIVLALLLAMLASAAAVSAQTPPGGVNTAPPPGPAPRPVNSEPAIYSIGDAVPYDFVFTLSIYGTGFKSGESVVVLSKHGPSSTALADTTGTFQAMLRITWVYCGPRGAASAPPVIEARGSLGSRARLALGAIPCPGLTLISPPSPAVGPPGPAGGGTAASGTVGVSGTAVASGSGSAGSGSGTGTPGIAQKVPPSFPPRLERLVAQGHGFFPGERVTIRQLPNGYPATPAVTASADALGRFRVEVSAYVPGPCGIERPSPYVIATGDRGTAVIAPIVSRFAIMIACPAYRSPQPGTPGPAADNPPVPAAAGSRTSLHSLSLRLGASRVRAGSADWVRVRSASASALTVTIRYPGGRIRHVRRAIKAGKPATLRWRVPEHARRGKAILTAHAGELTLPESFRVI